jgi:hypothetical protein
MSRLFGTQIGDWPQPIPMTTEASARAGREHLR